MTEIKLWNGPYDTPLSLVNTAKAIHLADKLLDIYSMLAVPGQETIYKKWGHKITCTPKDCREAKQNIVFTFYPDIIGAIEINFPLHYYIDPDRFMAQISYICLVFTIDESGNFVVDYWPSLRYLLDGYGIDAISKVDRLIAPLQEKIHKRLKKGTRL